MFYVIEEGTFTIYDNLDAELARIGKGSCFGELALLRQDVRAANVKAVSAASVLALHRDDFNRILGKLKVWAPSGILGSVAKSRALPLGSTQQHIATRDSAISSFVKILKFMSQMWYTNIWACVGIILELLLNNIRDIYLECIYIGNL